MAIYVAFCLFVDSVQNLLIYLYGQRHYIFGGTTENHLHLCLLEVRNFVTCFSERMHTASMSSTNKQLKKVLTAYGS